ncbi:glycosyltransferase [Bacteroides fragilis]
MVNYHDPLIYSRVNGIKIDAKFHVSRELSEMKYLSIADLIITSCETNKKSLTEKYPQLKRKIVNNYFGYIEEFNLKNKVYTNKLRFAYGGRFGKLQSPEIFAKAFANYSNTDIELFFVGNYKDYQPIKQYVDKFVFIEQLPYEEYLDFLLHNVDVGLLSLSSTYLGACIPSKLYEYINLGLPMLGALPDGDAKNIINNKKYGIACSYNSIEEIRKAIDCFMDSKYLFSFRNAVLQDRNKWRMSYLSLELVDFLNNL